MSELYYLKAVAYSKLDRHDEAQKLFSRSTQLSDTSSTRTWINWAVYIQIKKNYKKLIPETQTTPTIENTLSLPTISIRQQAINNLKRLEQILLEQHPTIVRAVDIIIEQLHTINETFFEYMIKRLYECQRKIYQDLFENRKILSNDIKLIIQHLKDLLNNDEKEFQHMK
ncbi:unnamed protein product [Adineta steineri]|uniref:Uncharacterized protein n=2 Tax=Adineta steineri TaxID=433720 RepID=A0A815LTV1_9BILA|nr:unnamed protein product [Adineta steineri]